MRRHAHGTAAHADKDFFARQHFKEILRDASLFSQAEIMSAAQLVRWRREPKFGGSSCELAVESTRCLRYLLYIPLQQLLHGAHGGGQQSEVRTLTHVEAPRAFVVIFGVQNQAREILGIGPLNPILLQWYSAVPFRSDVENSDGIGSEQPLVAGGDSEIGLYVANAKGQRAERLRQIENESRAKLPAGFTDAHQVELAAAGPLHMRQRGDGYVGRERV